MANERKGPIARFREGREQLEGFAPGLKALASPRLLQERERTNAAVSALFADESALSRFAPETVQEIQWQATQPMTRDEHRAFRSGLATVAQTQLEWQWEQEAAHDVVQSVGRIFDAVSPVLPSAGVDGAAQEALARELNAAMEMAQYDPERALTMADNVRTGLDSLMGDARTLRNDQRKRYQAEFDDLRAAYRDMRDSVERAMSPLIAEAARQQDNPAWLDKQADKWAVASVLDALSLQVVRNEAGRLGLSFNGLGWNNDPSAAPDMTNAQLLQLGRQHMETVVAQEGRNYQELAAMLEGAGFGFAPGDVLQVEDVLMANYSAASMDVSDRIWQALPETVSTELRGDEPTTIRSLLGDTGAAVSSFLELPNLTETAREAVERVVEMSAEARADRATRMQRQQREAALRREMIQ